MDLPLPSLPPTQIIERTRHRHADVRRLVDAGWTISAIGRRLNLDRKTIRRFRDTDLDVMLASARERRLAGVLESFKPYLNARFTEASGQSAGVACSWRLRTRLPGRPPGGPQASRCRAGTAEPIRGRHPQSPEDHFMDHAAPRVPDR